MERKIDIEQIKRKESHVMLSGTQCNLTADFNQIVHKIIYIPLMCNIKKFQNPIDDDLTYL